MAPGRLKTKQVIGSEIYSRGTDGVYNSQAKNFAPAPQNYTCLNWGGLTTLPVSTRKLVRNSVSQQLLVLSSDTVKQARVNLCLALQDVIHPSIQSVHDGNFIYIVFLVY